MPTQTYFELLEMLEAEGQSVRPDQRHVCPLCVLTLAAVQRYLELLSLENVNDIPTRQEWRASGGFCARHTYQWASLNDALGTAILYEDLLREVSRHIQQGDFQPVRRNRLFGLSSPEPEAVFAPCPLCRRQEEAEERFSSEFAEGFAGQPRFRQAYTASEVAGLCLPHYRRTLTHLETKDGQELGRAQQTKLAATQARLRQIIEKMDASRKLEGLSPAEREAARQIGAERESLTRALWQMVGLENVK